MKMTLIALSALAVFAAAANAALITGLTVQSATENPWNAGSGLYPIKAINGAGLPGGIPALSGAHSALTADQWWSYDGPDFLVPAQITINLGGNYAIDTIHVWNYNEGGVAVRSTKNVAIYVSPDEDPAKLVKLVTGGTGTYDNGSGDFLLPQAPGAGSYTGLDLDLSGVTNVSLLGNARLLQFKPLDSYDVSAGVGLAEVQFGGELAPQPASTFQVIITPNGANYDFSWDSQAGKLYDLVSATDLATPILEWLVYGGHANMPSAGTTTTLLNVPPSGTVRFFAMIERDAPPLFKEDFEADNGGFAATGNPNDWAWGTPNSNNGVAPDLVLTTGARGSTKCWGTNLGDGSVPSGLINTAANSILRSPNIDLTGISGGNLAFAAAVDASGTDTLQVLVKEVGSNALLATINPVTLPTTATWVDQGPFDLSAADNKNIYLEFRYQGTDGSYIGFYIDDVAVTVP